MEKAIKEEIAESCGNVFADSELPDADEILAKAELASEILNIIKRRKLIQQAAAELLGTDQSYISKLKRGSEIQGFTLDRLTS